MTERTKARVGLLLILGLGLLVTLGLIFYVNDPNRLSPTEIYRLYKTVERGDMATLKKALEQGINPNVNLYDGGGCLIHAAVKAPDLEALFYLLKMGANVDCVDPVDGSTALIDTVIFRRCDAAKALLTAGADPNLKYRDAGLSGVGEYEGMSAKQIFEFNLKRFSSPPEGDPVCWKEVADLLKR